MKILVIGGTRLLGSSVVRHLLAAGHGVTVLSRNRTNRWEPAAYINAERRAGLAALAGESFDMAIDFLAYDAAAVTEALASTRTATYVLISSVWLPRLRRGSRVDEPIAVIEKEALQSLPPITRDYLCGKHGAEVDLMRARATGRAATVLRLPIFFGSGEHTGRVEFYRARAADGRGMLCVNGGRNIAQVAWVEDLARALCAWLPLASSEPMWDGIAGHGLPVRDLIGLIADASSDSAELLDADVSLLQQRLPLYLEHEPLWREAFIAPGKCNMFARTGTAVTAEAEWLPRIEGAPDRSPPGLRAAELKLIESLRSQGAGHAR